MGKKHCRNKYEVIQMVRQQRRQEAGKPEPPIKTQLKIINAVKPAIDRARNRMAEKNRRESQNDID